VKQHDDYISGRHHYWLHFWCGFWVGAALGGWIGFEFDLNAWPSLLVSASIALVIAYSCGRRGERAWSRLADWFRRSWWI
jgi:hypothetical protein